MRKILVIGAGRSASTLIKYLLEKAQDEDWMVKVGDFDLATAEAKVNGHPRGEAVQFDALNDQSREALIKEADLVISLLPPHMHTIPAKDCLRFNTHLVTASYVSPEMLALHEDAKKAGLVFMNEMGADPGIDHMSAMEMIEAAKAEGGKIKTFKSYCGAIVAPDSSNLWGYKFTWAPRNIILAGQGGTARYLKQGRVLYLPFYRLFSRTDEIEVPGVGRFEAYANRNSLPYEDLYGLEGIDTLLRATLRPQGFSRFWNHLVQIGLTDNSFKIPDVQDMSYRDYLFSFIKRTPGKTDKESLALFIGENVDSEVIEKFAQLDFFTDRKLLVNEGSPADILQSILMEKWHFEEDDHDMVVMQHQLDYEVEGKMKRMVASMADIGKDSVHTSISRTVGYPVGMGTRQILRGNLDRNGVLIPNFRSIYDPVLEELKDYGIHFNTTTEYLQA